MYVVLGILRMFFRFFFGVMFGAGLFVTLHTSCMLYCSILYTFVFKKPATLFCPKTPQHSYKQNPPDNSPNMQLILIDSFTGFPTDNPRICISIDFSPRSARIIIDYPTNHHAHLSSTMKQRKTLLILRTSTFHRTYSNKNDYELN